MFICDECRHTLELAEEVFGVASIKPCKNCHIDNEEADEAASNAYKKGKIVGYDDGYEQGCEIWRS